MEEKKSQYLIVETETVQAVINYLQTRPWAEANGLISALAQSKIANLVGEEEVITAKDPSSENKREPSNG